MASLLDQLLNEIAALTGLSVDEVSQQFTQEQLNHLLNESKCEEIDSVGPLFDSIDDVSCKDDGAPSNLVDKLKKQGKFPSGLKDAQSPNLDGLDNPEPPFDGSKCVDSVNEVNDIVKKMIDDHTEHNVLLTKLYELQDNLRPLEFYYKERAKRLAEILGIFQPLLLEIKRLELLISKINNKDIPAVNQKIQAQNDIINGIYSNVVSINEAKLQLEALTAEKTRLAETVVESQEQIQINQDEIDKRTANYPALNNIVLTNYQYGGYPFSSLVSEISSTISTTTINQIENELTGYSEYVDMHIVSNAGSFSSLISNPVIFFDVKLQDLNYVSQDKENFDIKTGNRSIFKKQYFIKNSKLLIKDSFFKSVPGYVLSNIQSKRFSQGILYTQFYNKLEDPTNEFFSLDERGLSNTISQLDPKLKGGSSITKREKDKEYFIKDLDLMQGFYQNFENIFEERKKQVRNQIVTTGLSRSKSTFERIAKLDIDTLLAIGRVNFYIAEENSTLRSIVDRVKSANIKFSNIMLDLDTEITRIEDKLEELKPTSDKIKTFLKKSNSECFDKLDEPTSECNDVQKIKGSDPFFESLDGIDPTLPNFSQACYWKEFAKLANTQGLFPIPNNPTTLRYWPVGLVIPTPATLIKIPLPIFWIPLLTISTPLGVMQLFLTINGIFISPVMFFLSASGYKQHLITIRGSSKKFGSDKDDELIKPTIKIPIGIQATRDMQKIGGKIDVNKVLTKEESAKIEILNQKKQDADSTGDKVRSYKAKKEIDNTKTQATDRVKPDTQKMKEAADRGEKVEEMTENIKKSIFKVMDDLGKPPINRINKLKEEAFKRQDELKSAKLKAMEAGNSEEVKRINQELKTDGLDINDKTEAYTNDLLDYFDTIPFSKEVLPKQPDKLDPKEEGTDGAKDKTTELSSTLQTEFISDQAASVKSIVALNIAKHKSDIEAVGPESPLNVEENTDEIKRYMKAMADVVSDKAVGKGSNPVDPSVAATQLKNSRAEIDSQTSAADKEKAKRKYEATQVSLSKKMDAARVKQTLSITPAIVTTLSTVNVSMDPFAPCCAKDSFSLGYPFPALVQIPIDQGFNLVKSSIDNISLPRLKSLFGGKKSVSAKDIRLGLLNISKDAIPDSIKIPKPDLNLKSATSMFSGILKGLSVPQAKFPSALSVFQLDRKITINSSIVKPIIKNALKEYLSTSLLSKNAQSLDTDFIYTNPNDIKAFMKQFIESMTDEINKKLDSFYKIINAVKSANGTDLNILEKGVFKQPPFGPVAEKLFIAKGLFKLNLKKSNAQFIISDDALKVASSVLKTALTPIVSNPIAFVIVAGAGVTGTTDLIRKIHPILSADDIPPWERLTMKNILFLVFLDEFISTGADQVGFFRSFL